MPNIKSSIRSVKTDAERRAKNAPVKAAIRNIARKVVALTETGTQEDAKATYVTASGLIDKAAPPLESPSSLDIIVPVKPSVSLNVLATFTLS